VIGGIVDFAEGGDSGSWVVNENQELLGILLGADCDSSPYGSGLVTPIHDITEEILATTEGHITLP